MAIILDGKKTAAGILEGLKQKIATLPEKPFLSIIRIGEDPASVLYTTMKKKRAEEIGIVTELKIFPAEAPEEEIIRYIRHSNTIADGIIVQLPVPAHLNQEKVLSAIDPERDVDGLTLQSLMEVIKGNERHAPATPQGVVRLLEEYNISPAGKHAVIIGRSALIGKPLAMMLLHRDATISICHSKTKELARHTRQADILISAVGKPHFITADMVKENGIIIDVGINQQCGETKGDIHPDVAEKASFIAPVPGGVGPMTIAMLLEAVVLAKIYKRASGENKP